MSKWTPLILIFLVAVTEGRNRKAYVGDKKNMASFGGVGGYSGVDNRGVPFGGVGIGMGAGGSNGEGASSYGGFTSGIGTLPGGPTSVGATAFGFGGGSGGGTGGGVARAVVPVGGVFGGGPSYVGGAAGGSLPIP